MVWMSATPSEARMLWTRSVRPSQIGPCAFITLASVQSSIRASRMAAMPPALRERIGPDQHAAAGGRRHLAARIVHPAERIEHLEEIDEGRNEGALGEALAAQFRHQRGQDVAAATRHARRASARRRGS